MDQALVSAPSERAVQALREDMNRLRGKLFGLVETTGMPDKQQEAFKRLIRELTYNAQANIESKLKGS